jgi:nucleotide-binding universal stress UspA family protein
MRVTRAGATERRHSGGVANETGCGTEAAAMSLKDIFVCLDPSDAGEARLRFAAALAREHRAHLSAACVLPEEIAGAPPHDRRGVTLPTAAAWLPPTSAVAGMPAAGATPEPEGEAAHAASLADIIAERFRAEVQPHAIEGDWFLFGSGESRDLVALLAAVDLVIYGQTSPDYRLPTRYRPEDIIMRSGRPMLVVPYAGEFDVPGRRVIVAWDGSREAARALHDALPLIGKAEAVTVMAVRDDPAEFDRDRPSIERIVRHLARHGIAARPEETVRGDIPIGDVLLSRAADLDADLIVAGAYHHSQFREVLLGGASRELLDRMTVPVLMTH